MAARADAALIQIHERYRQELAGFCYRMLGSPFDAEDAVQETLLRAWRGMHGFEGRASLRVWLYRIATNVCLDMLQQRGRRAVPMHVGPAGNADVSLGEADPGDTWVQPAPDTLVLPADADPADLAILRDTVRLAFVAALQHLSPQQRAVLILRDVLRWRANEVAQLLDTTVAAANGMLRRARTKLSGLTPADSRVNQLDAGQTTLLRRYVEAFERSDIDALIGLLHEDATLSMPPYRLWLSGADEIGRWFARDPNPCADSRVVPLHANGSPAFASYHTAVGRTDYSAFAIHILTLRDTRIAGIDLHLNPELFRLFGLPIRLELEDPAMKKAGSGGSGVVPSAIHGTRKAHALREHEPPTSGPNAPQPELSVSGRPWNGSDSMGSPTRHPNGCRPQPGVTA